MSRGGGREKPWGGRFRSAMDPALESFSSSVHFDHKLARQDIRGSIAHARMLERQGILAEGEAAELSAALERVLGELEDGSFVLDPRREDIHMNVEHRLGEIVGPLAAKLHSGRSRNDQIATDLLLWIRDEIPALRAALLVLRRALVDRAESEIDVVLPGYTHLQRAQPVRLAHHWLAHAEALARDDGRLRDARARVVHAPLGAGALAGSTLPLDREGVARELGFAAPNPNSLDAVASRDAALELLSALAIAMVNTSRLCEELVLWSSQEFDFVEMADAFSTGSSLMPQKKNPDAAELVRGKSGRVVGALVSLLVTLKGLPLAYNRDMQEDKEPLFDAAETARASFEILAETVRALRVKADAMARAADDPMLLATDLADHLVAHGVAFREAHEVVGRLVAHTLETGTPLDRLSREELRRFHAQLDLDPGEFFRVERSLEARTLGGGPSRDGVVQATKGARDGCARTEQELES